MNRFLLTTIAVCLLGCGPKAPAVPDTDVGNYSRQSVFHPELIKLRAAVQAHPSDGALRLQQAAAELDIGNPLDAESQVRHALTLGVPADTGKQMLGLALLAQGAYQKAIAETPMAPGTPLPGLLCVHANANLGLKKPDAAKALFEQALQIQLDFPAALVGLGRLAYLAHDEKTAQRYAERALAAAPNDIDALLFQGDLLASRHPPADAITVYDRLLASHPLYFQAHLGKAYQYISNGAFDAAQDEIHAAYAINPRNVLVGYTQALLDFSQGRNAEAQARILQVLRVAPDHPPTMLLAGAIYVALGSKYQAEYFLQRYLEKYPDHLYARKMLASLLLRTSRGADALQVLGPAMKTSNDDIELMAMAGESYMQVNNFTMAQSLFEHSAAAQPDSAELRRALGISRLGMGNEAGALADLRRAVRMHPSSISMSITLVRTLLTLGHFEEASHAAIALADLQRHSGMAQDLLGLAWLGMGDLRKARASFNQALVLEPACFPAVRDLVRLDLQEGKTSQAREHLLAFLNNNNTSVDAMQALAMLAIARGDAAQATRWLERASAASPDTISTSASLMAQYLRTDDAPKAIALAGKLLVTSPANPDLLDLLGKAQLANHEDDKALLTFRQLTVLLPRSAQARMEVAAVLLKMKRNDAAREMLKDALALQPDLPAALMILADMYITRGWYELALPMAMRLQQTFPKETAGYQLEGDILMGRHHSAQALAVYERALALRATSKLTVKAVTALRAMGKTEEAAARLARWRRDHPADSWVALYQAETEMADQQVQAASATLESLVQQEPRNVVALNNLAQAYERLHDARAQATAESAYALAADQPAVMDTLGWILVEQGNPSRGLPMLTKAAAQAPGACAIRFHLAMALFKAGNTAAARNEMLAVGASAAPCAEKGQAQTLLAQW